MQLSQLHSIQLNRLYRKNQPPTSELITKSKIQEKIHEEETFPSQVSRRSSLFTTAWGIVLIPNKIRSFSEFLFEQATGWVKISYSTRPSYFMRELKWLDKVLTYSYCHIFYQKNSRPLSEFTLWNDTTSII